MSHSQQTAAEGPAASRTRKQTEKRTRDDDAEEEKQPAQSSAHVSPAMRIYRHALESIFALLNLHDLTQILAVSRSWSAEVRSMKPIRAPHDANPQTATGRALGRRPLPSVESLIASPLLRHLDSFEFWPRYCDPVSALLTREALALVVQHAPNLRSLSCRVSLSKAAPWILPAKLRSLHFDLASPLSAADVNSLFRSVSELSALYSLCLWVKKGTTVSGVDFSLLGASASLTDFTFKYQCYGHPPLSDGQVAQIRSSLGHLQRFSLDDMDSEMLARFLRPPVNLQWQDSDSVCIGAAAETLLVTLPSLTKLHLYFREDRPHLDFLSQLPLLEDLELRCSKREAEEEEVHLYVPPAALLNSLLPCTGLTELSLECGLNCAQLTALFASLADLGKLTIHSDLESLQCFASGPITQSLEELHLYNLKLPKSELVHLSALTLLCSLWFESCFPPLDADTLDSLSPPTAFFPLLTELVCDWQVGDQPFKYKCVERTGPSFDWMQKRLVQ